VIWRESRFDPQKFGGAGERGLMQVSEKAANEWANETHFVNFRAEELFDPKVNVEAGAWYLRRALQHWQNQTDPVPFALAEYNAGASRAQRWAGENGAQLAPETFRATIDFPSTRNYVDTVTARFQFYKQRGRL
jgi:soluble lytic murein transglycosylase